MNHNVENFKLAFTISSTPKFKMILKKIQKALAFTITLQQYINRFDGVFLLGKRIGTLNFRLA